MTNFSILERNIFDSLGDCENAQKAFVRALDKFGALKAERFALDRKKLVHFLDAILPVAAKLHGLAQEPDGLRDFIFTRHYNFERAST